MNENPTASTGSRPAPNRQWLNIIGAVVVGIVFGAFFALDYWYFSWQSGEHQVREVLNYQKTAWNEGNLEEFMSYYWNSDELTFYSGDTVTQGWQATLDRYRKKYQAEGAEMGQLEFSDLDVEPLSLTTAVVRGRWELTRSSGKTGGLFTLVFREIDGKWKIVHDHTSAPCPEPKPKPNE